MNCLSCAISQLIFGNIFEIASILGVKKDECTQLDRDFSTKMPITRISFNPLDSHSSKPTAISGRICRVWPILCLMTFVLGIQAMGRYAFFPSDTLSLSISATFRQAMRLLIASEVSRHSSFNNAGSGTLNGIPLPKARCCAPAV